MAAPHLQPWSVEALENAHGKSMKTMMEEAMGTTKRNTNGVDGEGEGDEYTDDGKKKKKVKKKRKSFFDDTQNKSLDDEAFSCS